jgi:DNA-binding transcriptional LysR family regulator
VGRAPYLRSGRLRPVLADWNLPSADIYIVFPTKANMSARTRVFVDFMLQSFQAHRHADRDDAGW